MTNTFVDLLNKKLIKEDFVNDNGGDTSMLQNSFINLEVENKAISIEDIPSSCLLSKFYYTKNNEKRKFSQSNIQEIIEIKEEFKNTVLKLKSIFN